MMLLVVLQALAATAQETPNAQQARRIFEKTYNMVFGPQGATLHYDVNIVGLYKTQGTIWYKEKKQKFVDELNAKSGKPYRIDLSMGMCEFCCADVDDLTSVIKSADNKLYEVKRQRKYNPYKNEE